MAVKVDLPYGRPRQYIVELLAEHDFPRTQDTLGVIGHTSKHSG